MKIVLVHGEHTLKSYERFQKLIGVAKDRGWEVIRLNGFSTLPEIAVSSGLFAKKRLLVVSGFNTNAKKDINWINRKGKDTSGNLLIYHQGTLTKSYINLFPKLHKVEEYKLPRKIWTFLDSFFPGNMRNALLLFNDVIKNEPPEFVFALLSRLLRDLYWVKKEPKSMSLPPWRSGKLTRQASKFTQEKLKNLIGQMAKIDIKVKTSKANLTNALDFLIISELE